MHVQIGNFLEYMIFGNSVLRYLITIFIFVVSIIIIKLIIQRMLKWVRKLADKTVSTVDDFLVSLLEVIVLPLLYLVSAYIALKSLVFPENVERIFNYVILGIFIFFVAKTVIAFTSYGFSVYLKRHGNDGTLEKSLQGIMVVIRLIIWTGAIIFFLDNLGFKISAVIAGLGIGGVAVALAAQTILKDLFSYFCILFDHPFKVGDFIIIEDFLGTIEHIGIKTTRVRSLGGEMLIFSNSDLTDSRVRNYQLMEKRRVLFRLGVTYQTSLGKLKEIPKIIENIIKNTNDTIFDRAHFLSYGDFSLIFEIVFYVIGPDYNKYMDIQQEINFAIKETFEKLNIEFAYPTQTLFISKQ